MMIGRLSTLALSAGLLVALGLPTQAATVTASFDFTTANTAVSSSLTYTDAATGLQMKVTNLGGNNVVQTWAGHGLGAPTDSHHLVDSSGVPETILFEFSMGGIAKAVSFAAVKFTAAYVNFWDKYEFFVAGTSQGVNSVPGAGAVPPYTAVFDPAAGPADNFAIGAVGSQTFWSTTNYSSDPYNACTKDSTRQVESGGHYEKKKNKWGGYDKVWVKDYVKEYKQTCFTAFKITSLSVSWEDTPPPPPSSVPLPAGGLLVLSALAGLGVLRKRRAA